MRAGRDAPEKAALAPYDVDLLVFASASRDVVEPATAHIVQAELGSRAHALDMTNACDSFVNGIDTTRDDPHRPGPPGPGRHPARRCSTGCGTAPDWPGATSGTSWCTRSPCRTWSGSWS
ncbi:hypothetical protein OG399_43285 [Streptomyces achromogenes]